MTTDERLERLERELIRSRRRFHWLIIGAGLCLISAAGVYANRSRSDVAGVSKELRATSIVLEDLNGKPRASLGMDEDGLVLRMRYENGNIGAALCLHEEKVVLNFSDNSGKPRAVLGLAKKMPLLCLYDEREEPRATLALLADGPHLVLRDEKGNPLPIR
ncbi:hypothetical protein IMZ48_00285 [Candidatus Bathyarchaeota archaeon]|nr:hypothetical protein [Candidatus Bathyarchaeota archaeon]